MVFLVGKNQLYKNYTILGVKNAKDNGGQWRTGDLNPENCPQGGGVGVQDETFDFVLLD